MVAEDVFLNVCLHVNEVLRVLTEEVINLILTLAPAAHRAVSFLRIIFAIADRDKRYIVNVHKPVLLNYDFLTVFDT